MKDTMGNIDDYASEPQVPGTAKDPGKMLYSIDLCEHGGINSTVMVSMAEQCPGSTATMMSHGFKDDVAQYMKNDKAGFMAVRDQAFNAPVPDANNVPPLIGKQDSDPAGG